MSNYTYMADRMRDVVYGDEGEVLLDEITGQSRWETHHRLVFKLDGLTLETSYSVGSTEQQDRGLWADDEVVTCWEVEEREVLVKQWGRKA